MKSIRNVTVVIFLSFLMSSFLNAGENPVGANAGENGVVPPLNELQVYAIENGLAVPPDGPVVVEKRKARHRVGSHFTSVANKTRRTRQQKKKNADILAKSEFFECPICLNDFKELKAGNGIVQANCGATHQYCRNCLTDLIKKAESKSTPFECPECRRELKSIPQSQKKSTKRKLDS